MTSSLNVCARYISSRPSSSFVNCRSGCAWQVCIRNPPAAALRTVPPPLSLLQHKRATEGETNYLNRTIHMTKRSVSSMVARKPTHNFEDQKIHPKAMSTAVTAAVPIPAKENTKNTKTTKTTKKQKQNHHYHQMNLSHAFATRVIDITKDYPAFASHPDIHPLLQQALQHMELVRMTEIQAQTFAAAVNGQDVLGRSRTGSGKTVGFLLPSLQRLLMDMEEDAHAHLKKKNKIQMLIIAPTRELAQQTGEQAKLLTAPFAQKVSLQVMVGGINKNNDLNALEKKIPTILVSTPGRLQDHLDSTTIRGQSMVSLLDHLQILVLDETDRLLDMGFQRDIERILKSLPKSRQTLLFSATIPDGVVKVIEKTMRRGFTTVDCIHDDDDSNSHTNIQVQQSHVILPTESRIVSGTLDILLTLMNQPETKIIAFFPTANLVALYAAVLTKCLNKTSVLEIHSRKTQSTRERVSKRFRETPHGVVLLTSDVSARGVDYPDVTHVLQFGIADSRESYIHRLGRTGRAGKEGEGILVLTQVESKFMEQLSGLDIPVHKEMQALVSGANSPFELETRTPPLLSSSMTKDVHLDLVTLTSKAYVSVLGFYKSHLGNLCGVRNQQTLVHFANSFASQMGYNNVPQIPLIIVKKMGLAGVSGLNVVDHHGSSVASGSTKPNRGRNRSRDNNRVMKI